MAAGKAAPKRRVTPHSDVKVHHPKKPDHPKKKKTPPPNNAASPAKPPAKSSYVKVVNGPSSYYPETLEEKVTAALNDLVTPEFIDDCEYASLTNGISDSTVSFLEPYMTNQPIIKRVKGYTDKIKDWCLFDSCEQDRRDEAKNFYDAVALSCQQSALSAVLPEEILREWQSVAQTMADNKDDEIKKNGLWAKPHLDKAIGLRESGNHNIYDTEFHGDASYVTGGATFNVIRGMEGPVKYWHEVHNQDANHYVLAPRYSKSDVVVLDVSRENIPKDIPRKKKNGELYKLDELQKLYVERMQEKLNAKLGCKPVRNADGFIKNWIIEGDKNPDLYTYNKGQGEAIDAAIEKYREYQPYLESIFMSYDLPPYLTAIVIFESKMIPNDDSPDDARGFYQIIDKNMNNPKYGVYWDPKNGIDERRNILISAMAAAKILKEGRDAIMQDGFVPDMKFDKSLATMMSTSAYNAGIGNLKKALRAAKSQLESKGFKIVTGEQLFSYILTRGFNEGEFRKNSQDYPPQLYPVIQKIYHDAKFEPRYMPDIVLAEIPKTLKPISIREIINATNISEDEFFSLNHQLDRTKADVKINLSRSSLDKLRIIIPRIYTLRLQEFLERDGYLGVCANIFRKFFDKDEFPKQFYNAIQGLNHYANFGSFPEFGLTPWPGY